MRLMCEDKEIILRFEYSRNPHILITGQSGSGKSTLMSYLSQEFCENNIYVVNLGSETDFMENNLFCSENSISKIKAGVDEIVFHLHRNDIEASIMNLLTSGLKIKSPEDIKGLKDAVEETIISSMIGEQNTIHSDSILKNLKDKSVDKNTLERLNGFFSSV